MIQVLEHVKVMLKTNMCLEAILIHPSVNLSSDVIHYCSLKTNSILFRS